MKNKLFWILLAGAIVLAVYTRSVGLFRGLPEGIIFHPDETKQVMAIHRYLQGEYVWYLNSRFFDGYPFFLNHVDEWIIRGIALLKIPFHGCFASPSTPAAFPSFQESYYWGRALRVVYGLIVVILGGIIAGWMLRSRRMAFAAIFIMGIAPLSFAVTHAATGDVGVDLFSAFVLLLTARYVIHPSRWSLIGAGFFAGLAFAAKYQGALSFGFIISLLLFETVKHPLQWRDFCLKSILSFSGFLAGAIAGTPALFINTSRTIRDMATNFVFIQNYKVSSAFLEKPLAERIVSSLNASFIDMISCLGIVISFLCMLTIILLLPRLFGRKRNPQLVSNPQALRYESWFGAVAFTPFAILVISTALKPHVQPFHFSYLQLPLVLGALWFIREWSGARDLKRWIAGLAGLALLLEIIPMARREVFFWKQNDTQETANAFVRETFIAHAAVRKAEWDRQAIKYFDIEPLNIPVFRNSSSVVSHDNATFLNALGIAPVPSIPLTSQSPFIYMNGPILPRNDRMFFVTEREKVDRWLIYYNHVPHNLKLGLRTGSLPAEIKMSSHSGKAVVRLSANEQSIHSLPVGKGQLFPSAGPEQSTIYIVPLTIKSRPGPVEITVLGSERETAIFNAYGARSLDGISHFPPQQDEHLFSHLDETRFLYSAPSTTVHIAANQGVVLTTNILFLPAGRYRFAATLITDKPGQGNFTLSLIETNNPREIIRNHAHSWKAFQSVPLTSGIQAVQIDFIKPYAPVEVTLQAHTEGNSSCEIINWRMDPNGKALVSDLADYRAQGIVPPWFSTGIIRPEQKETSASQDVQWEKTLQLSSYVFPSKVRAGAAFEYGLRFKLLRYDFPHFNELFVFVHLVDGKGNMAAAFDFSLSAATFDQGNMDLLKAALPPSLPSGYYTVEVGLYNGRTQKRWHLHGRRTATLSRKSYRLCTLEIQ